MILQETYTLANGIAIPKLGLGTWFIDNNKAAQAVRTAVELGYRLIDTAQAYHHYENLITLPLHTRLSDEDAAYVTEQFADIVKEYLR